MASKIAYIVRDKRIRLGLSQEQMAKKMGVTINYVSLIENGKKSPGSVFLANFAKEFNVPFILLTQDEPLPTPKNPKEKETLLKLNKLMSDLEELFLKSAN